MHLAIRSSRLVESPAARLLGTEHPLTLMLDRRASVRAQAVALSSLFASSLPAAGAGVEAAVAVAVAAGGVGALWCCRLALVNERCRDLVLDLIVAGGGRLPLEAVARERVRLLDARRRRRLGQWLEGVAEGRDLGFGTPGRGRPLLTARVIASCRRELIDVASLARGDEPDVAGVALLEQLVSDGCSPLYGEDARALRCALWRIRFLLSG
jgi:hypothetical protein